MKNVNELRIPAYAVVDTVRGGVVFLSYTREEARSALRHTKIDSGSNDFKIAKLKLEKFIR